MTSPYAELFDAVVEHQLDLFSSYNYKSCFTVPAFDILGSYSVGDNQEAYILEHTVLLFGGYYVDEKSTGYGACRQYLKMVVEMEGSEYRVTSVERLLSDDEILQACEPIPALHDTLYDVLVLEKGEKPQPVWSTLPLEEALMIYLDSCDVEVNYIIDWDLNRIPIDDFIEEIANNWENTVHFRNPPRAGTGGY